MTTVSEVAQEIAAEIEKKGHYRGNGRSCRDDAVCIITSSAYFNRRHGGDLNEVQATVDFRKALAERLDIDDESVAIEDWNDSTSTRKVLSTLRSL